MYILDKLCTSLTLLWHSNTYQTNSYLDHFADHATIRTQEHFYHLGASETNRNSMTEALILSPAHACKASQPVVHQAVVSAHQGKLDF